MKAAVLYSFRRCPFAMRARLAISYAGISVQLREVVLKDKPKQLLAISAKATVPVLVLDSARVIDESLDIMLWALDNSDPDHWLENLDHKLALIDVCDRSFKPWLDKYKYADRFPEFDLDYYRARCCEFISVLENRLQQAEFLWGDALSLADTAIFPFIRQFAHVDKEWFYQTQYLGVQRWLSLLLESELFVGIMCKYPAWHEDSAPRFFPAQ